MARHHWDRVLLVPRGELPLPHLPHCQTLHRGGRLIARRTCHGMRAWGASASQRAPWTASAFNASAPPPV
eukprot:7616257-Alexandrium_andersonii.AAC.1